MEIKLFNVCAKKKSFELSESKYFGDISRNITFRNFGGSIAGEKRWAGADGGPPGEERRSGRSLLAKRMAADAG